jgi:hypothetical protein
LPCTLAAAGFEGPGLVDGAGSISGTGWLVESGFALFLRALLVGSESEPEPLPKRSRRAGDGTGVREVDVACGGSGFPACEAFLPGTDGVPCALRRTRSGADEDGPSG